MAGLVSAALDRLLIPRVEDASADARRSLMGNV
jgi:hypothetical protein